jgi:hypothetical protein
VELRTTPWAKLVLGPVRCLRVYRYRLVDQADGADIGPLISARLAFTPGETITRRAGERYEVLRQVKPENENFRAYLIVRRTDVASLER